MKVGIFSEMYLPHVGGQEVRYAEMAETLVHMGHSVDVYCIHIPSHTNELEDLNGVRVHRRFSSDNYTEPLFKTFKRRLVPLVRYALWCRNVVKHNQFDIIICNQFPLAHVLLLPTGIRKRALLDWCEVRHNNPFPYLQRLLPPLVGANIAVSRDVAAQISSQSGCPVGYVPSGINIQQYECRVREERKDLLYIGRIMEHKNLELLVDAFLMLRTQGFADDLVIGGTGPALDSLKEKVRSVGLERQIKILGHVSEKQKVDLLSRAAVFVIPSRREGFPRVVAEAMASGLPVATVDHPENGTKAVVAEYGIGTVCSPDADALASSILDILRDWEKYSSNAAHFSPELDWKHVINDMLQNLRLREAVI